VTTHQCRCSWAKAPHRTWGACQRSKSIRIGYCRSAAGYDATRQKKWDKEIDAYKAARAEGIQPEGTTMRQIEEARRASDQMGVAYDAGAH
jgi:hypothetical protein